MEPGGQRKQKSRMVSFRVDEDDFVRLDALTAVSRVHAELVRSAKTKREKRIVGDRFASRLPPPGP